MNSKKPSEKTLKDLALTIAVTCVRNTVIENYHAEGKISDDEMMAFNKEVADKLYTYFHFMFNPPTEESKMFSRFAADHYPAYWDEPKLDKETLEGIDIALHGPQK